jgi:uncharacterized protein (DUF2249 family)
MKNQNPITEEKIYDGRTIPCAIKHGQIVRRWLDLGVGDHFVLINDHDPVRMREKFETEWPGAFAWEHLQKEGDHFTVKITKLKTISPAEMEPEPACSCGH